METILKQILEITAFSSVLILFVMTVKAVWRSKIDFRIISFLWVVVLFRLLIPVMFSSPIHIDDLFPAKEIDTTADTIAENIDSNTAETDYALEPNYTGVNTADNYSPYENTALTYDSTPKEVSLFQSIIPVIKQIDIWTALFVSWIMGMGILTISSLYNVMLFSRKIRSSCNVKSLIIKDIIKKGKSRLSINKEIQIIRCTYVSMPVTFGWIKPKILIPYGFENRIEKEKLELVMLHELYHIKRNDILKNYLWLIAKAIHWFNPIVWIAYKEYVDDIEIAVDNSIIKISDEKQVYNYSQSIIDVIRMSNKMCSVPMALSFCKDKDKIRQRIENMIKPKKKVKSAGLVSLLLAVMMIVTCFTTACQPTPESLVVQNKGDNDMEKAISETAQPKEDEIEYQHIVYAKSNNKGRITVKADADILMPEVEKFPVAYVERDYFTQEQVDKMLDAYFGDRTMYVPNVETKGDLERCMIKIEKDATNLDSDLAQSNGIDNLEDLRKAADERLAMYQEMWEKAPETKPVIEYFDINTVNKAMVDPGALGKAYASYDEFGDNMARVHYSTGGIWERFEILDFGSYAYSGTRYLETYSSSIIDPNQVEDEEFLPAMQNAQDLVDDMGIEGFKLSYVCLSQDETHIIFEGDNDPNGISNSDSQFYVFCFERLINSMTIDNSFFDGTHSENTYDPDDPRYEQPMPYEKLQVWTDGSKIVQFKWEQPIKIAEIANDNVEIQIDVDDALNNMSQQVFIKYADMFGGYADDIIVEVNRIQLVLARVKEKDTGKYLAVPVWDFYGQIKVNITDENAKAIGLTSSNYVKDGDYYVIGDAKQSLLTINSLDGTILDRELGH